MKQEDYVFIQIVNPKDIDKLNVEGFEFFKGLGIIDYKRTFKAWLRKFPKPVFIVVTKQNSVISWVHIDEWREGVAKDGNSINILRAIETLPEYRSKRIGNKLVFLALRYTVGYMITKPVSPEAKTFFARIGFKDENEFPNCPVDLQKHPGYLVLPLHIKSNFIKEFAKKHFIDNLEFDVTNSNNANAKS
ncbi:MAG: hypothetical protein JSV49_10435 [Thermoplasmata archaeon]|nr:MAG: hypothetical protein JSV49_10435 [Thermoplasmata archaeon]